MKAWPKVRLGEVLHEHDNSVPAAELTEVNLAGVYSFARGLFKRGPMSPGETSYKSYNRLVTDDFVISTPKAWEGALALVTPEFDGWFLSPVFPTFRFNREKLLPKFLEWYCKRESVWGELQRKSRGIGARRESVHPEQFLSLEIPLPPLAEQRRVVARIEELAAKIHEARSLRHQTAEEADALPRKTADELLDSKLAPRKPLVELLSEPLMNGLSVPASRLGSGVCFAKVGVVNSGVFNASETKLVDVQLADDSRYWLRKGDIVVSRGNSPEFVGRSAVYEGNPSKCAMPDLLIRIRLDPKKADTRFVSAFFHSTEAREYIAAQISGTSSTMPKISQPKLEALPIPVPPLTEQRRIVAELDALQAEVDALKHLQAESSLRLEQLLPSILDRAFSGEL